jgi:hypothetical protein
MKQKIIFVVATLWAGALAYGQTNFDFGANAYTGTDGGPAGLTLTSGDWFRVNGDTNLASGITIDLGRGASGTRTTTITWTTLPDAQTTTFSAPSQLAVTDLYTDGRGGGHSNGGVLGARVNGLAPGTYDVYAVLTLERGTYSGDTTFYGNVRLGLGDMAADQTNELVNAAVLPWSGFNSNATTWVSTAGNWNFISNRVTIVAGSANSNIIVFADLPYDPAVSQTAREPILLALQIVAIPEPSALALVGVGLLGAWLVARRRR